MYGTVRTGAAFDLVVMAASQGGLAVYRRLLAALPREFPAAVVLLLHRPASHSDQLPGVLAWHTSLPVRPAAAGERPRPGTVYVAPAERQLLLDPDGSFATAELRTRVALADPLFAAAAAAYRDRLIAVVASGRLADGAAGVRAVKQARGRVLVQDQASAECFGMPGAAITTGCVDFVLPLSILAPAVVALVMAPGAAQWLQVPVPSWAPVPPVPAA